MRILTYILSLIPIWILASEKAFEVLACYVILVIAIVVLERLNYKNTNEFIMKDKRK